MGADLHPYVGAGSVVVQYGTTAPRFGTGYLSQGCLQNAAADAFLAGADVATGTVEAWFREPSGDGTTNTYSNIFSRQSATGGYACYTWTGNLAYGVITGSPGQVYRGSVRFDDGNWHHVFLQWANGVAWGGIDGTVVFGPVPHAGPTDTATSPFAIGGFANPTPGYDAYNMHGDIDEVRLSTVARYPTSLGPYTVPSAVFTIDGTTSSLYHLDGTAVDTVAPTTIPVNSVAPSIPSTATVGQAMSCSPGTWTQLPTGYAYQWDRNGSPISGASNSVYNAQSADVGQSITCVVTATNAAGSTSAGSNISTISASTAIPVNTSTPAITGSTTAGQVLYCSTGTWSNSPTSYLYQWDANGSVITGATSSSYTSQTGDVGKTITCVVSASNASGSANATSNGVVVVAVTTGGGTGNIAPNDPNIVYSPFTWSVSSSEAKTIDPGAYLRMAITGGATSISLNFNIANDLQTPLPQFSVIVDGQQQTTYTVAGQIGLVLPNTDNWTVHTVDLKFESMARVSVWNPQETALEFLGVTTVPATCTTMPVGSAGLVGLYFGDSITEGSYTLGSGDSAGLGWAYMSSELMGAEAGVVGQAGTGMVQSYAGVPGLVNAYNLLWGGGPARVFDAPVPNYIVIAMGANDSDNGVDPNTYESAYLTCLNDLLAATPATTIIFAVRPFDASGTYASTAPAFAPQIQSAVASCSDPSRVVYVDTTGWFTPATETVDGIHPLGFANKSVLAPKMAAAIRAGLPMTGGGGPVAPLNLPTSGQAPWDAQLNATLNGLNTDLQNTKGPSTVTSGQLADTQDIVVWINGVAYRTTLGDLATFFGLP